MPRFPEMTLWDKLNLKDQSPVVVLNAPPEFAAALATLDRPVLQRAPASGTVTFAMAFAITKADVDRAAAALTARAGDDAILWFCYPKQTSKRYRCEFNRDSGWAALGRAGYEGVRQVAIDDDWSALRFRQVGRIKTLRRAGTRALSAEGKRRTSGAPRSTTTSRAARKK